MQLAFNILSWGAWSPAYQDSAAWKQWRKATRTDALDERAPTLTQVPSMQRRRFSRLTKMMLHAAFTAAPDSHYRTVFASRHGELNRTIVLLENVLAQQPLSPTGFSQSVHNTASGLHGIVTKNTHASTSIAAGSETLAQAMYEAYAQLQASEQPLLLVYGDDPVPPIYDQYTDELEYPLALALLLSRSDVTTTPPIARLAIDTTTAATDTPLCYGQLLQALATGTDLRGEIAHQQWQLQVEHGT